MLCGHNNKRKEVMANTLTGFQIVAINGLQNNLGLSVPNSTSLLNEYDSLTPVSNFTTIFNAAPGAAITPQNVVALQNIGAASFPQLFGAVPYQYSNNLQIGILMPKVVAQINKIFGNSNNPSIFVQALTLAQAYASQSSDIINSAISATWNGNPSQSITGGFSALAGNNAGNLSIVADAFSQLGSVTLFNDIQSGFTCAAIMQQILNVDDTIGNLHINFFGKMIIDPQSGNTLVVNQSLLTNILNNPIAPTNSTFAVVALNPLEQQLQILANQALVQTADLDSVITFVGMNGNAASSINQFSDCLNPQLMLGPVASSIVNFNLNTTQLDAWTLLNALVTNIKGISNITNFPALALTMAQVQPLGNLDLLAQMQSPITASQFSALQASLGPGSGANGNPTVADILGSTDINDTLQNVIFGINQLSSQPIYQNISTDTTNVAGVLLHGISGSVKLSNGNTYTDPNSFCADAAVLINNNANSLVIYASNNSLSNSFSLYSNLAQTVNNSQVLMTKANINISSLQTSITSMVEFGASLSSVALQNDEVGGLDVIIPIIDNSTLTGQAFTAIIIEAQNNQILNQNGIVSNSFDSGTNII